MFFLPVSDGVAEMPDLAVVSVNGAVVFRMRLLPETTLEEVAEEVAAICSASLSDFRWVLPGCDEAVESSSPVVCGPTAWGGEEPTICPSGPSGHPFGFAGLGVPAAHARAGA